MYYNCVALKSVLFHTEVSRVAFTYYCTNTKTVNEWLLKVIHPTLTVIYLISLCP